MNTNPARGMRDFLPEDKEIREYVKEIIRDTYKKSGFQEIETPAVENIENLLGSSGGENLKLIYKILKRGEKLDLSSSNLSESDLTDLGLRYDLTLPLCRYYANNRANLPKPFKSIQIGEVYRAERSQKGRYRCFVQCDVDVMAESDTIVEIDLINTVANALVKLSLDEFKVRINDRRVLKGAINFAGFSDEQFENVCMILDKLDKIHKKGVLEELKKAGYEEKKILVLMNLLDDITSENIEDLLKYGVESEAVESLKAIIEGVTEIARGRYKIEFDFSLVRGMGYYTGSIFEIEYGKLGYSVAGGGRYDELIGRFIGEKVPACGFSIGFERIVDILKENKFSPELNKRIAVILDSEKDSRKLSIVEAEKLRDEGYIVSIILKQKKFGKQLTKLVNEGFQKFAVFNENNELELKEFQV